MGKNSNLETQLWALHRNEILFGEFVVRTRHDYEQLATHLLRRWRAPEWFTQEDMEQELYLGTWKHVWGTKRKDGTVSHYNPALHGPLLSRGVMYAAVGEAKRKLHIARGVTISGSPDSKPSVLETPASFIGDEAMSFIDGLIAEPPIAEEMIERKETRKKVFSAAIEACETSNERYVVLAIGELGGLAEVAVELRKDPEACLRFGVRALPETETADEKREAEDVARNLVSKYAGRVARRLAARGVIPG